MAPRFSLRGVGAVTAMACLGGCLGIAGLDEDYVHGLGTDSPTTTGAGADAGVSGGAGSGAAPVGGEGPGGATDDGGVGDSDGDGIADGVDNCPKEPNAAQDDGDGDAVGDACDNCPAEPNAEQADLDTDTIGDLCDRDRDGDRIPNELDPAPDVWDTVYYYSDLDADDGAFESVGGNWQFDGAGHFCQTSDTTPHTRVQLVGGTEPPPDVVIQTQFSVASVTGPPGEWPGAGLAFRATSVQAGAYDAYVCYLNLRDWSLAALRYSDAGFAMLKGTALGSVTEAASYTMRVTAAGGSFTCELLPDGPVLSFVDASYPTGRAGFATYKAATCYDYLLVMEP